MNVRRTHVLRREFDTAYLHGGLRRSHLDIRSLGCHRGTARGEQQAESRGETRHPGSCCKSHGALGRTCPQPDAWEYRARKTSLTTTSEWIAIHFPASQIPPDSMFQGTDQPPQSLEREGDCWGGGVWGTVPPPPTELTPSPPPALAGGASHTCQPARGRREENKTGPLSSGKQGTARVAGGADTLGHVRPDRAQDRQINTGTAGKSFRYACPPIYLGRAMPRRTKKKTLMPVWQRGKAGPPCRKTGSVDPIRIQEGAPGARPGPFSFLSSKTVYCFLHRLNPVDCATGVFVPGLSAAAATRRISKKKKESTRDATLF